MASEILEYQGRPIHILRRSRQRSLRLHLKEEGRLLVTANLTVSQKFILNFIAQSWAWVEKTERKQLRAPVKFTEGESFLFLGVERSLQLRETAYSPIRVELGSEKLIVSGKGLTPKSIRGALRKFYRAEGRPLLLQRVAYLSNKMSLSPSQISFRCQKGRWGSCSSRGSISLNWRLAGAPLSVIDYVIVHELAHLKVPNHSKHFWALIEAHYADFQSCEKWLKTFAHRLDFLLPGAG